MPTLKYACKICNEIFNNEQAAVICEQKGLAELPVVGALFKYYDTNESSRVVGIFSASNDGHKALIKYMSLEGGNPKDTRMWGLDDWLEKDALWVMIRKMIMGGILPQIAVSVEETYLEKIKLITLQEMIDCIIERKI